MNQAVLIVVLVALNLACVLSKPIDIVPYPRLSVEQLNTKVEPNNLAPVFDVNAGDARISGDIPVIATVQANDKNDDSTVIITNTLRIKMLDPNKKTDLANSGEPNNNDQASSSSYDSSDKINVDAGLKNAHLNSKESYRHRLHNLKLTSNTNDIYQSDEIVDMKGSNEYDDDDKYKASTSNDRSNKINDNSDSNSAYLDSHELYRDKTHNLKLTLNKNDLYESDEAGTIIGSYAYEHNDKYIEDE